MVKKTLLTNFKISLDELYNEEKQIRVHLSDKDFTFSVILKNRLGEYDCKISSYGANLWFRTKLGTTAKKYSSLSTLQNSIIRAINVYVETKGKISFSISNEILSI